MVLVVIEATDVVFAVDSIPAIFAVTRDPFIVYTSNIFAILGLRALYFLLAGIVKPLPLPAAGLGLVLAFVGAKMLLSDRFHIPNWVSLVVIAGLIGGRRPSPSAPSLRLCSLPSVAVPRSQRRVQ